MILNTFMIIVGFSWTILATFFRTTIDPWFDTYPLLSTIILATVLLTYATSLILAGCTIGKPFPPKKKKQKGVSAPPVHYILQWILIGSAVLVGGIVLNHSNQLMSWLLWLLGGVILLSQFLFVMTPSSFQQESNTGEIVSVPNRLMLKEGAYSFWDTAIMSGGFFLTIGALLKSFSLVGELLSIGTGLSWVLGAIAFSVVSSFYLGGMTTRQRTSPRSMIPEENFSLFPGAVPVKYSLMDAHSSHIDSLSFFQTTKNGILFWGASKNGRLTFTRALAGETSRAYMEFQLSSLKNTPEQLSMAELKKLFYKINLHKPALLYIPDYQDTLSTIVNQTDREAIRKTLLRLLSMKDVLVVMGAADLAEVPQEFRSAPYVQWTIELPVPDHITRIGFLRLSLLRHSRTNDILPGNVPLLTEEMIEGLDLSKLSKMMEGFSLEDIEDILEKSFKNARNQKRSLRQLDIDVSIRRKMQGWEDPTLEPMDSIRTRMTDEAVRPALVLKGAEHILKQKRRSGEAILIVGKEFQLRKMIAQKLAEQEKYHFSGINQKEFVRDSLGALRNFIIQNKRMRPVVLYVDPLEVLFPRVQLSHFGYHGEIYNQKVIELSQSLQERQFWIVCGTTSTNEIDPMILRKFSRIIEVGDLHRELMQDVEGYAMEKLLEGSPPEAIDFSRFHLFAPPKEEKTPSGTPIDNVSNTGSHPVFRLSLLEIPPPPISGFFGRESLQNGILNVLETARMNIRTGGSSILGSFLFLGPPQSGKKTLSEHLSLQIFKKHDAFVYRDMGLYDELYFASQFIRKQAEPPRSNPPIPEGLWDVFSNDTMRLVYLDNVERAHPSVWDSLLSVFRDGKITWKNKILPIPQSIFVLSSTLFSPQDFMGAEPWERPERVIRAIQNSNRRLAFLPLFQAPFLKQLDLILSFPEYGPDEVRQIVTQASNRVLHEFGRHISREGSLTVDPELYDALAQKLDVPRHGLTRLDKTIQTLFVPALKQIQDRLSTSQEVFDFVMYWNGNGISMNALARNEAIVEVMPTS
ncbi:MAG: AAA family ATPase [Leptospirales bacterium]